MSQSQSTSGRQRRGRSGRREAAAAARARRESDLNLEMHLRRVLEQVASSDSDDGLAPASTDPPPPMSPTDRILLEQLAKEADKWKYMFEENSSSSVFSSSDDNNQNSPNGAGNSDLSKNAKKSTNNASSEADADEDSRDNVNYGDEDDYSWDSTPPASQDGFHSDSELSDKDKWPCHQCGNPTFAVSRYCLRCFQVRRNWLPKRPRPASKNAGKNKRKLRGGSSESEVDGQPRHLSEVTKKPKIETTPEEDELLSSLVCAFCCVRDKDAAFVHDQIAHRCCCFPCADKILKRTGKCPICRERILRVVKMILV